MASLEELRHVRIQKLQQLKEAGMFPYERPSQRTHANKQALEDFETLLTENKELTLAGRIMAIRGQGAIIFVPLYDGTETMQAVFKEEVIDAKLFRLFQDTLDIADFIEVTGTLFRTERGAQSILVKSWTILTKALQPLPDKWHGLADTEEKYRKRYLGGLFFQRHNHL